MKLRVLGLLCFVCIWISNGIQATTLSLGDIAITGYNSDGDANTTAVDDEFVFVLLTDISGTTIISFTDRGWLVSGGFRAGEGTIALTITSSYSCGDEIRLVRSNAGVWSAYDESGGSAGSISLSGDLALSSSGDQIFAYHGATAPTLGDQSAFITALHFAGAAWDADATGTVESAQPPVFGSNPGNDFAVSHADNGKFDCDGTNSITSGLPPDLRANIYTASNWEFTSSSSGRYDFTQFCEFSCAAACIDPVITSLTTNSTIGSNTFCPGDNVIITVSGTPGDATVWNLYTASCGGSLVSSTPAVDGATFTINPIAATTTYYVGGTGGCVASPTCATILITVNGLTANAGSDQKVSGSTTANISGNGAGTWSIIGVGDGAGYFDGVPGASSSSTASTTFSGTAGQQYELRWTVTNTGCTSSTDDVMITFLNPTTLGLGDIAFTGYNSDNPDEFSFVLLEDIDAGTEITFTDNGWQAAGGFRSGENTITFEFCRPYSCGDEFSVTGNTITDDNALEAGTSSGSALALAVSGDQIFAYQGTAPATGNASNFIAAIQMNGAWDSNATSSENSAQPSAFTDGVNSISISPEMHNAQYNCSITTNSAANLAAAVNTASNWTTDNDRINLSFCSFTCGSCVEPVLTSVVAPASACPGQTVALTINGTLNGATEWAIYTGSCGGTLVGTTTSSSFDVIPTATTTYYVSGRGGCVVTESCQTASITVGSVQADAGPDQKLNGSSFTSLQANGGFGDGTWTFVDAGDGQGSFSDASNPSATFSGTPGQSYTLKWTIDNSGAGCPDTEDEVTIVFLSPTGLMLGDIAFISYSADEDDFAFVILKDINAGTTIKFTDQGWKSGGGFRGNEGTITVEFCRPYNCGDEFNVFDVTQEIKDASGQIAGTITGVQLDPSTTGDQIFAYQGNEPTAGNEGAFIAAIQMNGAWDNDAVDGNTSAQPSVFTDGINSISISPEVQNAYIDCSKVTLATGNQINNSANWITSNSTSATLPLNCNLTCCTPGDPISISGYTGPDPLCPSSQQTLSLPPQASLNDDDEWVWYTGSCGGTEVARDVASINVSPTVTTTYYVRTEGSCSGTSGACVSFTVEIGDIEDPVLTCPADITVGNDAGDCSAVVDFSATATDNCDSNVDITYSQNPGTSFDVGTTQVDVTATDDFNRTANCSFNVTVNDTEAPTANCPGVIQDVELDLMGNGILFPNIGDGNSTDNCGSFETSPELHFTCDDLGEQMVTLTAVDPSGNTNAIDCSFNVVDNVGACNQAPVAECRSISVSADPNSCEITIDEAQIDDGSFDPDGDMIQLSLDNTGPFAVGGPYTVELTVSDGSLIDKCTAQVTVTDDEAPTFSDCPGNISVGTDIGICGAIVTWTPPTLNDNCPGVSSNSSHTPGAGFPVGSTTVVYIGSDAAGNIAPNCSFVVTVNDTEAPTFSNCPGNISVGTDPGDCGANVDWQLPIFGDNCPGGITSSNYDPLAFFPVGSTTVTYEGSDAAGNAAIDCSFVVTVNDTEVPTFSNCPGNISVGTDPGDCGAKVDWELPIFSDNCPGGSTSSNYDPLDFFPVGSTTVTYEGSDAAGNAAIDCSFVVTVNDTEKPSAQCRPTTVTLSSAGTASITAADVDNGSTDNCNIASRSVSPNSFDTGDVGASNPVTLTVVDIYGNVDTCHTTVTVEKRASILTNLGVFSGQYSDQVTLEAQLKDINGTPLANQDITFEITGELPTVTAKTNASGIATAYVTLTQAPNILGSNYQVKTSFAGSSLFEPSQDADPFEILQEDALVTYTGTYFVSTATVNSSIATVTLAATVQDIADGFSGDIRNARVTFYDRTNGSNIPISPALPVQLITPSDLTVGNVVYEWENVDIGNADSEVFEIGIVVSYYYTRNSMADNVMVTISKPISSNFITGGGYLILNNSAGQVAGDDGSKSNFGFNVKYNKKGTKLKGKFQALIRRTESDGIHTYRIKSNKLTSLSIDPNTGTATLSGKANIQDVTDPNNPISVTGNNIFTVTMVDNGEPGTSDAIGITLYNTGGGVWYSSNWSGTQTVDQIIAGGNIVVHSGGNGNLQAIETLPTSRSTVQEGLDINIYPNPAADFFQIDLRPFIDSNLSLQVFHVNGQLMHTKTYSSFSESILRVETSNWMSGMYFIKVIVDNELQYHKKILIQHP